MTKTRDQILAEMAHARAKRHDKVLAKRQELTQKLLTANIGGVKIEFSGSGDSGSIDLIEVEFMDGSILEPTKDARRNWEFAEDSLHKELESFAYDYLETTDVDWYNNEGGQGTIEFDLRTVPFAFRCDISTNEIVSHEAYSTEEVC